MTLPLIDPVLTLVLCCAGALVFLHGAFAKWREREIFAAALQNYELIPEVTVPTASTALILAETVVGLMLLVPAASPLGQVAGIGLLLLVTAAIAINLLRGRTEISCGCGGNDQQISWGLVARNLGFAALLGVAALPHVAREWLWLDYAMAAFGGFTLAGLYAVASQLLGNHPRLVALRDA